MSTKYVMMDQGNGVPQPFIFTEALIHQHVTDQLYGQVISAGFVSFIAVGAKVHAKCYGSSISLNVAADVEGDSKIITRWICGN